MENSTAIGEPRQTDLAIQPFHSTYQDIPVDDVIIDKDRREVDEEKVDGLVSSITELGGLLQPIGITEGYRLIYGRHRLEAYRRKGWATIPAIVLSVDDPHRQLMEIDENLCRSELSVLQQAEAMENRKAIYEQLHPESKHGGDRKSSTAKKSNGQVGHLKDKPASFAEDTAKKTGKSERTVRRFVGVARNIPKELRPTLRKSSIADKQWELEKLGRLPEKEQTAVVQVFNESGSEVATVRDALKELPGPFSYNALTNLISKSALNDLGKFWGSDDIRMLFDLSPSMQREVGKCLKADDAISIEAAIRRCEAYSTVPHAPDPTAPPPAVGKCGPDEKPTEEPATLAPVANCKTLTPKRLESLIEIVKGLKSNADKPTLQVSMIDIRIGIDQVLSELETLTEEAGQ